MTATDRKVIAASSIGTVFEWYGLYFYGSLSTMAQLYIPVDECIRE